MHSKHVHIQVRLINYKSVYIHTITLRWSLWTFSVPAGTLVLKPRGEGGRERERGEMIWIEETLTAVP